MKIPLLIEWRFAIYFWITLFARTFRRYSKVFTNLFLFVCGHVVSIQILPINWIPKGSTHVIIIYFVWNNFAGRNKYRLYGVCMYSVYYVYVYSVYI